MNLFDRHRKFRNKLSAYIDGELASDAVRSLDAHLKSCDSCRLELDEMRSTVNALRSIPEVEAPRSFRLTPEMVAGERPAPSWSPSPGLMNGMRMATAGLTMALAVVLFVDLGGSGQDPRTAGTGDQAAPASLAGDSDDAPALAEGIENLDLLPAAGDAPVADAPTAVEDTSIELGAGRAPADDFDDGATAPVTPGDDETILGFSGADKISGEPTAESSMEGSADFDELLATEIALGAALALAAAGTAGMTFARSRSRQD